MGSNYFGSAAERRAYNRKIQESSAREAARIETARRELAAKIVMAVVDKIVNEIVRPGPKPEERECYEMAGELRASSAELEELAKQIIDVNDGVE
jgi:hypothetical protein